MKYARHSIAALVTGFVVALLPLFQVHALAPINGAVSLDVGGSCLSEIDGSGSTSYFDVAPGSTIDLTITNANTAVTQKISGAGISTTVGTSASTPLGGSNPVTATTTAITSQTTITFTPILTNRTGSDCPTSGPKATPSILVLNPVTATLSCTLNGNDWDLAGNFSGTSMGTGLYLGSTELKPITSNSSVAYGPIAITPSSETFTLVDGTNYDGAGTTVASATCPEHTVTVVTPTPAKTTPTTTSTPTITSTTTTPATTADSDFSDTAAQPSKPAPTMKTRILSDAAAYSSLGALMGLVLMIVVLVATNGWLTPRESLAKIRPSNRKARRK